MNETKNFIRCLKQDVLATQCWLKRVNSERKFGLKEMTNVGTSGKELRLQQDEVALCQQPLVYGPCF